MFRALPLVWLSHVFQQREPQATNIIHAKDNMHWHLFLSGRLPNSHYGYDMLWPCWYSPGMEWYSPGMEWNITASMKILASTDRAFQQCIDANNFKLENCNGGWWFATIDYSSGIRLDKVAGNLGHRCKGSSGSACQLSILRVKIHHLHGISHFRWHNCRPDLKRVAPLLVLSITQKFARKVYPKNGNTPISLDVSGFKYYAPMKDSQNRTK